MPGTGQIYVRRRSGKQIVTVEAYGSQIFRDLSSANMTDKIHHFKFHIKSSANKFKGRIELQDEVIHEISDFGEFYKACGYTKSMLKKGILPDDYIWETFFQHSDRNCTSCFQLRVIEYLLKYSDTFTRKFRHKCDELIEVHAKKRKDCSVDYCADKNRRN